MTDQGVYVVFSVIVCPSQQLLAVDVHVVAVVTTHRTAVRLGSSGFLVGIAFAHRKSFIHGDISTEREIFQEFGFYITAHVQVVVDRLILIVLKLLDQVVTVGRITRIDVSQRRVLLPVVSDKDFFAGLFIVHQRTVLVALPHLGQGVPGIEPIKDVLYGRTRVTSPTGSHRLLGTTAVSNIYTGFQPFINLRIDIGTQVIAVEFRRNEIRGIGQVAG